MNHFAYPATLVPDILDGGFVVTFVDLPEAITQGDDLADALHQAADCLEESIAGRISDNELIPQPSPASQAHYLVHLPAQTAVKATLYNAMRQSAMSQTELAKRLNSDEKEIHSLLDPYYVSPLSRLEEALHIIGYQLVVDCVPNAV
ncbi:MAG: type II toxin-antitoxin system HicB family antitoxin [Candidatus Parabeggiatoa sp. nov. 3]|nr:MAG: type II toxin-antitoxin system HicB family antitoxin [Gammaproteobacteria bacterium]RKZ66177.1 MAG: type II toxin-antitoxin system HicB family antitoxin [Gammaproteobacteria bacterium]RKZ76602.1 MAG: type II toxin-antitoxin system HicB family antitoxin [Gammaproteobacteria bacterium]